MSEWMNVRLQKRCKYGWIYSMCVSLYVASSTLSVIANRQKNQCRCFPLNGTSTHTHKWTNKQTNTQYAFKALKNEKLFQSALTHGELNELLGDGEYKWLSIGLVHALVLVREYVYWIYMYCAVQTHFVQCTLTRIRLTGPHEHYIHWCAA